MEFVKCRPASRRDTTCSNAWESWGLGERVHGVRMDTHLPGGDEALGHVPPWAMQSVGITFGCTFGQGGTMSSVSPS